MGIGPPPWVMYMDAIEASFMQENMINIFSDINLRTSNEIGNQ